MVHVFDLVSLLSLNQAFNYWSCFACVCDHLTLIFYCVIIIDPLLYDDIHIFLDKI